MTPVSQYTCVSNRLLLPPADQVLYVRLSFQYNMYGFHMGTLEVCVWRKGTYIKDLWSKKGSQSMNWRHAELTIALKARDRVRAYSILVSLKINRMMIKKHGSNGYK